MTNYKFTNMKGYRVILLMFFLMSCRSNIPVNSKITNNDSIRVDSIYGPGIWYSYFRTIRTPLGFTIKLKIISDSCYLVQWGESSNLRTYPERFYLDGHETRVPKFLAENKDYIVMRQGCGSPCWSGYFLPLNNSLNPNNIHEYLDFDLDNYLVASVKSSNIIEVRNLKTGLTEDHIINGCTSAFLGYCIDSLSIKDKRLKFKWIPETRINSDKGTIKIEKIYL